MPPATSKRENALATMATQIGTIAKGAAYNYTVDDVVRIDGPWFELLDSYSGRTIVFMEEGETAHVLDQHSGVYLSTMEVFVDVVTRYEPDSDNPIEQLTETKSTIRSKLLADLVKLMGDNFTLAGYAKRGTFLTDDAPVTYNYIDREDWTGIFTRWEVRYELDEDAP